MDVNLDGNTITNGYFSGIGEDLVQLNADNITSGTLPDARLSADVALTDVANTFTQPQGIPALSNLTANGFVKTSGGDGALSVETSVGVSDIDATGTPGSTTYLRGDGTWSNPTSGGAPVTLTGDAVGTGTGSVPVTVEGLNGTSLAGLATGLLKNTTATGVPSIAAAGTDYLSPAAIGTTVQAYNANTTTQGNTFNGASQLLQADGSGYILDSAIRPGGKLIYVSAANGSDTRTSLSKYSYQHPFATYTAAISAAASGDTIVMTDGTFTSINNLLVTGVNVVIMPSANFVVSGLTSGASLFTDNFSAVTGVTITGYGQTLSIAGTFSSGQLVGLAINHASNIQVNNLNLTVNYAGVGSASGISNTSTGTVSWIGTTITLTSAFPVSGYAIGNFSTGVVNFSGQAVNAIGSAISNNASPTPGTVVVGSLSDASGFASTGTGLTITSPQPIVQSLASPSTGFTQAFTHGPQDQNLVITPSGTLAAGTVTFPADTNTRIGQKLWISNASAFTITSLTVSVSGGTIYGYTTGPLPPGSIMFQKTAANVWQQVAPNPIVANPITTVTGTSQAAAVNQIYVTNNAAQVVVTLPSAASVGDTVEINGLGAGGWSMAQNASQIVHMSSAATTTGTGGSIASTNQYNSVKVRCLVANTTWAVIQSQGILSLT